MVQGNKYRGEFNVPSSARQTATHAPGLAADVGHRIRTARQESGLTLAQLGGEDLTRGFLSSVEIGRSSISLKALALIAKRLGLPMACFVDEAPELPAPSIQPAVDHAAAALA